MLNNHKTALNCSLLFARKDGGDRHGLKLEKTGHFFSKFGDRSSESCQKLNMYSSLHHKCISDLLSGLSEMLHV